VLSCCAKKDSVVRESAIAVNVVGSKRRCVLLGLCRGECERWTVCCMYCECKCMCERVCAGASASEQMKKEQVKPAQARHLPQLK
jgi:hypothetical protein